MTIIACIFTGYFVTKLYFAANSIIKEEEKYNKRIEEGWIDCRC